MKNKIITIFLFIGFFIFSLSTISSLISTCEVYDDFSGGSLNTTKWEETTGFQVNFFTDEHFVNTSEEVYHINQSVQGDRETNLKPTKQFFSGEAFSYDVLYNGGSGNHFSQPLINGNYPPTQIEPCLAPGGCGPIGFWNGVPDLGNQTGTYNIIYEFSPTKVKMTSTRPDGLIVVNTFTGNSAPYNLTINTHTGNNGKMHFDYDNFKNCTTLPYIEFVNPTSNSSNLLQNFIEANITFGDNPDTGIIYLYNSNGILIQSNSSQTSPFFINFTSLSDGTYYLNATVNDTIGNTNQTKTRTIILDTTSPTLSSISATSISSSSATITWTTNENANSSVYYGLTNSTNLNLGSTTFETAHSILLSSLSASTLYYYNVSSCDAVGNCNTPIQYNFTTSAQDTGGNGGGGGGGGGGGSSIKYYKCDEWGNWSVCNNAQQTRTCLEKIITTSGGVILSKFNETEIKACTNPILTPLTNSATEESENNNANQETEKELTQKSESFRAGITGAVTGFAKTKGGKTFLIVLGVLALAWIFLAFRRKKF